MIKHVYVYVLLQMYGKMCVCIHMCVAAGVYDSICVCVRGLHVMHTYVGERTTFKDYFSPVGVRNQIRVMRLARQVLLHNKLSH